MVDIDRKNGVVEKAISDGLFTVLAVAVGLGMRKRAISSAVSKGLFSI